MKRVKISAEIRQAIRTWSRDSGLTQTEIGNLIGVSNPTVNSWINGKILSIRPEHWEKLFPYIREFLGKDAGGAMKCKIESKNSLLTNMVTPSNLGSVGQSAINQTAQLSYFSRVMRKILSSSDLSSDEKIKFLKVITDGKE